MGFHWESYWGMSWVLLMVQRMVLQKDWHWEIH
jgi:hypothetical protein